MSLLLCYFSLFFPLGNQTNCHERTKKKEEAAAFRWYSPDFYTLVFSVDKLFHLKINKFQHLRYFVKTFFIKLKFLNIFPWSIFRTIAGNDILVLMKYYLLRMKKTSQKDWLVFPSFIIYVFKVISQEKVIMIMKID